jgi:hypothetical protein
MDLWNMPYSLWANREGEQYSLPKRCHALTRVYDAMRQMPAKSNDDYSFESHRAAQLVGSTLESNAEHEVWQPCAQKGAAPFSAVPVKVISSSPQSLAVQSPYSIPSYVPEGATLQVLPATASAFRDVSNTLTK